MTIVPSMVATTSQNGIIGQGYARPWSFPEEQQRLQRIIQGKSLIIGRKTFFVLRPLLSHCYVTVLSRDTALLREGSYRDYQGYGYWFVDNLATAYRFAEEFAQQKGQSEYFIIGGAQIFQQSCRHVQRLYLTTLLQDYQGDHTMPDLDLNNWTQGYHEKARPKQSGQPQYAFAILNR